MKKVKLHDKQFRLFIESGIITSKIKDLAEVINHDFANKKPIFLCVLNGSFLFASELIKRFNYDCEVSFVKLASYEGVQTTGKIKNLIGLNDEIKNRNVIVVEDIVDTGNTIYSVSEQLKKHHPSSVEIATLLYKPEAYQKSIPIKYPAIEVGNEFLVGFGLDYDGLGRNLEDIYIIEENN
ncbi:hypoxanthine phosphoribosyltransferase [Flavobacteriales bacterium]|jgi:hypoxanthine phosphoribosyltransferase|nr:hypoxanthine phosphoribosyltransferase [Flavobacteriales bacterium]